MESCGGSPMDCDSFDSPLSAAPRKPPRGVPRPLNLQPLRNVSNAAVNTNEAMSLQQQPLTTCSIEAATSIKEPKYSSSSTWYDMISYFRRSLNILRPSGEFTGYEAANILEEYLLSHKDQFNNPELNRNNAVKVLDKWLCCHVIRPIGSYEDLSPTFYDSRKKVYVMNRDEEHRLFNSYSASSPAPTTSDRVKAKCSRSSSLKRFFSPGRVKRSESGKSGEFSVHRTGSTASSVISSGKSVASRFFSFAHHDDELELTEDSLQYNAALYRLLTIVDLPILDDITNPLRSSDEKGGVSLLSSILSKMGFGREPAVDLFRDDEMDDLLMASAFLKPVLPWFQLMRSCAPQLYFERKEKTDALQAHQWARQGVQAVVDRYNNITHHGNAPLIPKEYSPILEAIVAQLIVCKETRNDEKLQLALRYLFLMLPESIRVHFSTLLHFLERTMESDQFVSLRNPYLLNKNNTDGSDNFEIVFAQLRPFIFSPTLSIQHQNAVLNVLMRLRKEGKLGVRPEALTRDMQATRMSRNENLTPERFAQRGGDVTIDADRELGNLLLNIIKDPKFTTEDKRNKVEAFRQMHPSAYHKYCSDIRL